MYKLLCNVKDGLSTTEIIDETPSFAFKLKDIDILREAYLSERYRSENRELTVTCLFGASAREEQAVYIKSTPQAKYAELPITTGKTVYGLIRTTVRIYWFLKNLILKYR